MRVLAKLIASFALATMLGLSPAWAGGEPRTRTDPKDIPDAQALIDACWDKHRNKLESGVTSEMRKAGIDSAMCIKDEIVRNFMVLVEDADEDEVHALLFKVNEGAGRFYWMLYNQVTACGGHCGTMFHVFHNAAVAAIYEDILRDVIRQREFYGL
jgi:hypothetical protein